MVGKKPHTIRIPGLGRLRVHEDVILKLKFRDLTFLLEGQETHLGAVPAGVEVGDCIMVSVPEMKATYIVAVTKLYKSHAYAKNGVEHRTYLKPAD